MIHTPVYRLSPDLDGLRLRIVGNPGGQGEMRHLFGLTVGQVGRKPADHAGLGADKKLFRCTFGCFFRISRTPQLKATVQAVDLTEALADQVGGGALAGVAVVAADD